MPRARASTSAATRAAASRGLLLGASMGLANALSFVFVLVLARPLGPASFGGYAALSAYGILLAIPAGALQVVVARTVVDEISPTTGLRLAAWVGGGLAVLTALASPAVAYVLHLPGAWVVFAAGLTLWPMTLTGVFQGVLLGQGRIRALSALYLTTALARLTAAALVAMFGLDLLATFSLLFVGAVMTAAVGWWQSRHTLRAVAAHRPGLTGHLWRSSLTLAAFTALTNVDVLLARQVLSEHESGGYALAATFARAMCWGTQFIALLLIPRLSAPNATRVLIRAGGLVLALGAVAVGLFGVAPQWWIRLAGGSQFSDAAWLVPWCVGVGSCWALAQIWLFSQMGTDRRELGMLTLVLVVAQCGVTLLWLRDSATQILMVTGAVALLVALAGLLTTVHRRRLSPDADTVSGLLAADSP